MLTHTWLSVWDSQRGNMIFHNSHLSPDLQLVRSLRWSLPKNDIHRQLPCFSSIASFTTTHCQHLSKEHQELVNLSNPFKLCPGVKRYQLRTSIMLWQPVSQESRTDSKTMLITNLDGCPMSLDRATLQSAGRALFENLSWKIPSHGMCSTQPATTTRPTFSCQGE